MTINKLLVAISFATLSLTARAEDKAQGDHPCMRIKQACEAGGFKKGDHKNKKGLYLDCMKPILSGQAVAGVTFSQPDVAACKAKKEHRHAIERESL